MATATTASIQGKLVPLEISADNGLTYKAITCLIKQGNELSLPVNETQTQCGTIVGTGVPSETIPFEGAVNVVPTAELASYVSYTELRGYLKNATPLMLRQKFPESTLPDITTKCYITELKFDAPVDNAITFSGSFKGFN